MREYFPRGRYLMPNQVESFVPCPIKEEATIPNIDIEYIEEELEEWESL